jgi:pimeloyl-ACP methyl ester carboxylesterase
MRMRVMWVSMLSAWALCACASWFPAPVPMRKLEWRQPGASQARCLVVFLPGLGDDAEDFERNGFVADVTKRALSVDVIAAQATLGYYARGSLPDRLNTDIVGPARARGYAQVWLIGMSMGGLGTVYYSRAQTAQITGILALAPYLGDKSLTDEIRNQGGLAHWHAPARVAVMHEDNYQRELWRWMQAVTRGEERGPTIYLGYGRSDKLAHQDALLMAALPPDHTYLVDGAHDWKTWKILLGQFLENSDFARDCR